MSEKLCFVLLIFFDVDCSLLSICVKVLVFFDLCLYWVCEEFECFVLQGQLVLIEGEIGIGKELFVWQIYCYSECVGLFVVVSCSVFSCNYVEVELFGYVFGIYNGLVGSCVGWFGLVNGGILYLDEIVDLLLMLQVRLLQMLEECEVLWVGVQQLIFYDVCLVIVISVDLDQVVCVGKFLVGL